MSWEPGEGSVSRREQLVISPRAHYSSRELCLPVILAEIYLFIYLTIIPSIAKGGRR